MHRTWKACVVLAAAAQGQESFELISKSPSGGIPNGESAYPTVSGDGRFVLYWSSASNLVPGDTNGAPDLFVRDLDAETTELVGLTSAGTQVPTGSTAYVGWLEGNPTISHDGSVVAFACWDANVVPATRTERATCSSAIASPAPRSA